MQNIGLQNFHHNVALSDREINAIGYTTWFYTPQLPV